MGDRAWQAGRFTGRRRGAVLAIAIAGLVLAPSGRANPIYPGETAALERPASRHANLETGIMLPPGVTALQLGSHQSSGGGGRGTGLQTYHGNAEMRGWGNLQFGLGFQAYDDFGAAPILGKRELFTLLGLAASAKTPLLRTDRLAIAAQGAVEALHFDSSLYAGAGMDGKATRLVGAVELPVTWTLAPTWRATLTPKLVALPDRIDGRAFFGSGPVLGAGLTWHPTPRLQAYGTLQYPLGSVGNAIDTAGKIDTAAVWTLGTRIGVTPRAALDLYATNGLGTTPATRHLTLFGDADMRMYGVTLTYTPGVYAAARETYRAAPLARPTARQRDLEQDGITLASGSTSRPGTLAARLSFGQDGGGIALYHSPSQDVQLEAIIEDYAEDASVPAALVPEQDTRYMLGGRLRLLDQVNGDPVSLSFRVLAGRDFETPTVGSFYAGMPVTWQASDSTAIFVNPRYGAVQDETIAGLGLGVNHRVATGLDLIGEVTAVSGERDVWAAGARYRMSAQSRASIEISATNAIGQAGMGTLIARDDAVLRLAITWRDLSW